MDDLWRVYGRSHADVTRDYVRSRIDPRTPVAAWVAESAPTLVPSLVCEGRLQRVYVRVNGVQRALPGRAWCTGCDEVLSGAVMGQDSVIRTLD